MTNRDHDLVEEMRDPAPAVPEPGPDPIVSSNRWGMRLLEFALLALIVLVTVTLRFRGIQWGTGYYLHPDELFMTSVLVNISAPAGWREYLDSGTSPLNPFNSGTGYIYGTFPLFVAKLVGSFTDYTAINNAHIPGRWLSALADTGTVVLVWWIGRMLWNRWTGLLTALLMAFTVLNIGASHYFTTDAWSTFFAVGSFAFVLAAWKGRRWVFYALAGLMVGLAASSKPNLLAAFGFLTLPVLETIRLQGWRALVPRWSSLASDDRDRSFPVLLAAALSLFVAIWTIRIAQPYMFEGPSLFSFRFDPRWLADVEFWRGVQSGEIGYPPSIQWSERTPIVFQLENMILWGMGPGLAIAALGGLAWNVWRIAVGRMWPSWITLGVVGWIGFHFLYFGVAFTRTQRYWLPAYPFLILLAAVAIVATLRWGWRRVALRLPLARRSVRFPRWAHPGLILPVLVVGSTILYGSAFVFIYSTPQTRVEASEWIVANVPDGSTIANEYWDLGLPVGVPSLAGQEYQTLNLDLYADENDQKLTQLIGSLQRSDYIVLSSGRLRDSITRMPWRYPMATRYYEALYSGELGFDQVAHFTSFPELFGVEIDDRSAEETLTVYDHPEVTIFQKSGRWDAQDAWYLLDDALGHGGLSVRPVQTQPSSMMLDASGQADVRSAASWNSIFDPGSFVNRFPVIAWYLAFQILAIPFVPVLWRLCPWLPDRGYAVAKTIGIFAIGWATWWLATLGWLDFGLISIAGAWLAAFLAVGIILRTDARQFVSDLRNNWRWIVTTEILLLGGYLIALWSRSHHPDLWVPGRIGTQLQNMATFNAMSLTPFYPAYDPWLAGGSIHDFTFGFMPWAVVTRLTGIVPETAYSLTLAMLVALVIVNAWMASAVLIARFRRSNHSWSTIAAGLLAPVLLLGIGSLGMAQRVGAGDWGLNFDGTVVDALNGLWTTTTSNPAILDGVLDGAWHAIDRYEGTGVLEFPLLSFLTGELAIQHLAMPLLPVGVILLFGYLTRVDRPRSMEFGVLDSLAGGRAAGWFLGLTGLVAGWTAAANPIFGLMFMALASLALFLAIGATRAWTHSWVILRDSALAVCAVGAVSAVSVAPFIASYGNFATRRVPLIQPLSVNEYIGHLGALIAIALGYLLWQLWSLGGVTRHIDGLNWAGVIGCGALILMALGLAFAIGHLALFLLLLLLLVGGLTWFHHDDIRHLMLLGVLTLVIMGGIVANRMIFETWTQQQNIPMQVSLVSWILLAVVDAPIVAIAIGTAWERTTRLRMAGKRVASMGWLAALVVLIGAAAVYPALGYPDRLDDRLVQTAATLDSFVFMEDGQLSLNAANVPVEPYDLAGDLAAVEWMRENLTGLPTIVEAPALVSGWGGRISALTGYPAVIGVVPVQKQQRPGMDRLVDWRYADVSAIYQSLEFDGIEPILQDYGVRVIYVGALERVTYPAAALAKFDAAAAAGDLDILYREDGVTLYFYGGPRDSREPSDS